MPWDDSVHATAVVSGTYEELLLYTLVPLITLYKTFYIMKTWASWPIDLIDKYTLSIVVALVSYSATWSAKLFELSVIYPLAWLRYNDWKYN